MSVCALTAHTYGGPCFVFFPLSALISVGFVLAPCYLLLVSIACCSLIMGTHVWITGEGRLPLASSFNFAEATEAAHMRADSLRAVAAQPWLN